MLKDHGFSRGVYHLVVSSPNQVFWYGFPKTEGASNAEVDLILSAGRKHYVLKFCLHVDLYSHLLNHHGNLLANQIY